MDMNADNDQGKVEIFEYEQGRYFVGGLAWRFYPEQNPSEVRKRVKKDVKENGYSFALKGAGSNNQYAFGKSEDGIKKGYYSIAAAISEALVKEGYARNFLAAIPINKEQWAFIAFYEGSVRAVGGDFVGREDQVRRRFMQMRQIDDSWQISVAPASWGIANTVPRTLGDLLPKNKKGKIDYRKTWRLGSASNSLTSISKPTLLIGACALLALAYQGYAYWQEKTEREEKDRVALLETLKRQKTVAEPAWKKQPTAPAFAKACHSALTAVPNLWPDGWGLKEAVCENKTLTLTWQRPEFGVVDRFLSIVPEASFSVDGNLATHRYPLTIENGMEDDLPDATAHTNAMNALAQRHDIALTFADAARNPMAGSKHEETEIKNWRELNWKISNSFLQPETLADLLNANGFRISKIVTTQNNGLFIWNLEGVQYVRK